MDEFKLEMFKIFKELKSNDKDYIIINIPLSKLDIVLKDSIYKEILPDPYPLVIKKDELSDLIKTNCLTPALIEKLSKCI